MLQAIAQLSRIFPTLPASAIADALGKSDGDEHRAANALFTALVNARPEHTEYCRVRNTAKG